MFGGRTSPRIDAKGRMSLPVDIRGVLQYREELLAGAEVAETGKKKKAEAAAEDQQLTVVMTCGLWTCHIDCYPIDEWRKMEKWIEGLPKNNETYEIKMHLVGNREYVDVDKLGRVLISPALREYAGISAGQVVVMGTLETFGIWSAANYAATFTTKGKEKQVAELIAKYEMKDQDKETKQDIPQ